MQTLINPTVAGTLSLLVAFPYLAPGSDIDVSGSSVFTSRFAGQPDRGRLLERLDEEQIRLISTVFIQEEIPGLTPQQQFEALLSFGEKLAGKIYDLPPDFAAVISAKLPELL
jgi:hypothetical protein